jgi:hypothetical protein
MNLLTKRMKVKKIQMKKVKILAETRNIKLAQKVDPGIAALREQLAKTQQGVFKEEEEN